MKNSLKKFLNFFLIKILPTLIFLAVIVSIFFFVTKDGLKTTERNFNVQLEGAVNNPGVYQISENAVVKDLIEKAGGFQPNYDDAYVAEKVNLARKVKDGEKIFIPFVQTENLALDDISKTGKININSASADQLDQLPGVGPATANKIIINRPYSSVQDLLNKKVVTQSVFEKIKDQIEI